MKIGVPAYSQLRDILREEIITGVIAAESRLTIAEIAERYKVSHMPVREAFQWLQGEGLIEIIPNKGARVLSLNIEFIASIYDIRAAIEGLLARASVANFTEEDYLEMKAHYDNFCNSIDKMDIDSIYANDRKFHLSLYKKTVNKPALDIYNKYSALLLTLRKKYGFNDERVYRMAKEHKEILDAIKAADANGLEKIVRHHAEGGKNDLLGRMRLGQGTHFESPRGHAT